MMAKCPERRVIDGGSQALAEAADERSRGGHCGGPLAIDSMAWCIQCAVVTPAAMTVLRHDHAAAEADDQQSGNQQGKSTVHGVSSWIDLG